MSFFRLSIYLLKPYNFLAWELGQEIRKLLEEKENKASCKRINLFVMSVRNIKYQHNFIHWIIFFKRTNYLTLTKVFLVTSGKNWYLMNFCNSLETNKTAGHTGNDDFID